MSMLECWSTKRIQKVQWSWGQTRFFYIFSITGTLRNAHEWPRTQVKDIGKCCRNEDMQAIHRRQTAFFRQKIA